MAQNQANFGLNFRVDKSGLNELKKSLQDIMRLGQKNSATGTMTKELEEACKAARQLETILDGAWNSKLGQLNLDKVNQGIKTTYHSVEELQTALGKTPQGQAAFNKMASQVLNTNLQLKQTNKLLDDMATSMANAVKWGITSRVFNGITRSVQDAFYYVKGLNSSLTDIRIVTGASADQMASFAEKANAAAKALGQTTRNYTDASLIYYQQGLSEADVEARTQTTLKAANVTGQSTEEVSELLTSVWNGYKVSAAEAEMYIDKIAAVAATTASDLEELSVGMSKVASAASLMGVDIDQLNAQLATIVSVTRQAPESVGTALKTIYARMGDIEAGLDGETTLGNYTEQMKEMGFNVLDAQGKLRDMGSVIEEIGGKWSSMTREQQLSLAQTVAGTRQYNNLLALFDNWDMYTNALNTSNQAMGTLQEQQDIYMESTAAHLKQLQAELEATYSSMLDTDTLNTAIDGVTALAETFNDFIEGLSGGGQALTYFGSMAVNVFSKQIGSSIFQIIQNIKSVKTNLEAFKAKEKWADAVLKDVKEQHLAKGEGKLDDSALAKEAQYAQKTLQIRQALTQEQYDQFTSMQAEIGLKERELNYLKEYKDIAFEVLNTEQASLQEFTDQLKEAQEELKNLDSARSKVSKDMKAYNENQLDTPDDRKALQAEIQLMLDKTKTAEKEAATEADKIAYKKQALILEQALKNVITQKGLEEDQIKAILEAENRTIQNQHGYINKIKQGIEGKKAAENGTLAILEEEQAARERILRQQQEQAEKQLKIQKAVQAVGTALEIGTALVNAMAVGFDKASSGAEKANAAFAGITGVAAGIMDYFLPGTGILVQGAFSLVKAGLEATGVWEKFENIFKSTAERVAEINKATSENNLLTQQTNQQVASIKEVEEEYEKLSQKTDEYGFDLSRMTEEEKNRYHELTNTFAQYNDAIILGYDEQGNAIVNNQNAIKDTIKLLKDEAEQRARNNLGNISDKLKTKNEDILEKADAVEAAKFNKEYLPQSKLSDLSAIAQQFHNELWALKEESLDTQITIDGTMMSVEELAEKLVQMTTAGGEPLDQDSFDYIVQGMQILQNTLKESDFQSESILGFETASQAEVFQTYQETTLKSLQDFITSYEQAASKAVVDLDAANKALIEAQSLDTNYLLSVIQYGEGYDKQWDALSNDAQQIGSRLIIDYIENLEYGIVKAEADKSGQGIYETAVAMIQNFVESFGKAFELSGALLHDAIEKANLDEFKGTAVEYKEKITSIIEEVLSQIDQTELQDQETRDALEAYFKNQFGLSDLNIDFDSGEVDNVVTTIGQNLKNAQEKIQENLLKFDAVPSGTGGFISRSWLEGILDEDELANIDEIMSKFDFAGFKEGPQNLETFGEYLKQAAIAAAEAETSTSKYNRAIENNKNILKKFEDKESLTEAEKEYLSALEKEFPMLKNLQRGSKEYSEAMKKAQEEQTENYKKSLEEEKEDLENNLKEKRKALDKYSEEEKEDPNSGYQKDLEEIAADEARVQDIDYELNVVLVAEPSIGEQIKNLYNEEDTLISIRTTLEAGEGLSDQQTESLKNFFASDEGAPWLEQYLETGSITSEMLDAVDAFAKAKGELANQERLNLQQEAQDLFAAADEFEQKAQEFSDKGYNKLAEGYQKKANEKRDEAQTVSAEGAALDVQFGTQELEDTIRDHDSLDSLHESLVNGAIAYEEYSAAQDKVIEKELKQLDISEDAFEELVDSLQEASEGLAENEDAAKRVAMMNIKMNKGLESLKKSFKTLNNFIDLVGGSLDDASKDNDEYHSTLDEVRESLKDVFGFKPSEKYIEENLENIEELANGNIDVLDEMRQSAAQDFIIQLKAQTNDAATIAALTQLEADIAAYKPGDIEVAADINDVPFISTLNAMLAASQITAADAQSALNTISYDPEFTTVKKQTSSTISLDGALQVGPLNVPYSGEVVSTTDVEVPQITAVNGTNVGGSKGVNPSNTGGGSGGGGGKGGGGGGGGKGPKKVEPRKKDYYHNVNNSLQKLSTAYDKLAEVQDKTFGQKHIDNIKKTNENLDKQIDKMRERIKIANEQEKVDLKKEITKNYKDVKFNKDGTIKNYESILSKYYKKYQNAKTQDAQDKAKEKYDDLKELLDNYETLILETTSGWDAEVREKIDEKYENMIHQFEYEIEMRINWGETDRDVREFFKDFNGEVEGIKTGLSEIDFEGLANFEKLQLNSFINSEELTSKTRQIGDIIKEIKKIDDANAKGYKITNKDEEKYFSDVYGDNKQAALEDLKERREGLMEDLKSMKDARDNAYDTYLDAIDDGIEKMDKHIEQYEIINEEISHNMNLIEMLYGETSDMMEAQYDLQEANYLGQLKSLKTISDTYKTQLDAEKAAVAAMEASGDTTSQAYADAKERVEIYEDAYNESVSNLQKTTEEAVQNLIDKYAFGVKQVLDNMANSLFDSKDNPTLNTALTEWELMNKESEMYLDNINAAFEIQKLESKYKDALNSTDSITAQKKLNGVMESELGMLREKDKLSQYEIDHANLIYELTLKQIALEEAQQNKSKMRLRRDAQGNYSYQFTADTESINKAQEDVNDVLQQLTNLSQEKGKEIYDTALNETQNFIERMAEIEAMADGEEKERLKALTQENYNRVMTDLMSQSELVEQHIGELVSGPLAEIMEEEKQLFDGDEGISTKILSLTKTLRENIAGKGGMTNIVGSAMTEIKKKSDAYHNSLKQIEDTTGKAFEKLSDSEYVEGIKNNISNLTSATDNLAGSWKTTLDNIKLVIEEMDKALAESEKVQAALNAIKVAEKKEKTEYKAAGDAAEKANITAVADPIPEPQKTTKTETTKTAKTKSKKKTEKKIKVGGKVNAKGAKIYSYAGGTGQKQYFSNDPKYKVLKMSGNWIQVRYHKLSSGVTGWFKKGDVKALNTGGYTGDWNSNEGRIALLHKKELVLNQKDTKNILDAVNIIRGLGGLLQNSMVSRIEGLTQSLNGISIPTVQNNPETGPQSVEQTVHITAEFPGATEVIQIEQALENLVSRASQYAFRRKE